MTGASQPAEAQPRLADEDVQRAETYALLGRLLIAPPPADLLQHLACLKGGGEAFGEAIDALAAAAGQATDEALKREYNDLFIGLSEGELQPYGSYYQTGGLYRRPLAELRRDLARLGIAREAAVKEPEDHIAILCEVMAALILGRLGATQEPIAEQRRFFEAHLAPWAPRFFSDLEAARMATFYRPLGRLGCVFMAIETEAFALGR